ncbi:hypothetical protein VB776_17385 [Arcicella sp. DC2W]|uniref:Outer membrane protein beta-barrel domain-containing protein n=1 Tax=Arcicella gelida TaxID=2984195 RepID=A0ABU5S8M4_9BACT|nr:hypothetical protein [Arcicella sp. DC2W]MEA5404711.1 hypothetical protein [Arcicella sp. DC2W]
MKKIFVCLLLSLVSIKSFSQGYETSYKTTDLALAAGKGFSPAISFTQMFGVGKSYRFKIGYGVRLSSFFANDIQARTAPANLTSGKASFAALVSEDIIANIDTFSLKKVQVNALNLSINLQYSLSQKLEAGINIDAIGFTFGGKQSGNLIAKASKRTFADGSTVSEAKPTNFNLLLVSDSDLGSLNSEVFLRYWLNDKIGIRGGLSFFFAEYTSDKKVAVANQQNDRWRYKSLLPMLAVSFKF